MRRAAEKSIDTLPGWLFTAAGAALLAVVVLTPAWLDQHEAAWRLSVMRAQADALARQRSNYETFATALQADDPVVLERLALTHLNLSLSGKHAVRLTEPASAGTADVGAWLAVPQPVIGRDLPAYVAPQNRLVRLATGPGRPALLATGLACLIAGFLYGPAGRVWRSEADPANPKKSAAPKKSSNPRGVSLRPSTP